MKASSKPAVAYSYIRFSTPDQAKGDSLRRQTERAAAYCERRGWTLDTGLTLRDLGVSAFRGKNAAVGNFRTFLDAIKTGKVAPGSALIVESIDRISRQGIDEGYDLIKGILKKGIILVTLSPEREFDVSATKSLSKGALEIQLILERAAEESERKSDRVRQAQGEDLRRARENGKTLARRLPAWVEKRDGRLVLIPERAAAVRRIFEWAAGGLGMRLILSKLNGKKDPDEKIPPFGRSGRWTLSYVGLLLRDRRVIGEHQPWKDGTPDGAPLRNYFPAAVTEDLFYAARAGAAQRHDKPGRKAKIINPFAHILRDARSGAGYQARNRREPIWDRARKRRVCSASGRQYMVLEAATAKEGRATYSFPFAVFERAVFSRLREVDPGEVLGRDNTPQEIAVLEGQRERVRAERAEVKADMLRRYSSTLAEVAYQLEARERDLDAELTKARQKAATPAEEAWSEAHTLMDLIDNAPDPDDARLRLRAALRRIVDSIWLLVVPRGRDRLASVQVWFADGERHRDYLILHRPPKSNGKARQEGGWWARSLAGVAAPGDLDLRDRGQAGGLARDLEKIDLAALEGS
jgi:DNA invertase Pin-like site-specific DNA recombinase